MRQHKASLSKHFGDVTQAQLLTESPQDNKEDDVCGSFKRVEWSASSFMKGTS